jgi:hypothetical protein
MGAAVEVSRDSGVKADELPVPVVIAVVSSTVDQGTVLTAVAIRYSCADAEIESAAKSVDLCFGQDVVELDVDSVVENKVVFIMAD